MKAAFERQTEVGVGGASEPFKAEEACDLITFPGIMNLAPSLTGRGPPGVTDPDAQNCVVLGPPPKDYQETPAQVALGMVPCTPDKHRTGLVAWHFSPIRQERQPGSKPGLLLRLPEWPWTCDPNSLGLSCLSCEMEMR